MPVRRSRRIAGTGFRCAGPRRRPSSALPAASDPLDDPGIEIRQFFEPATPGRTSAAQTLVIAIAGQIDADTAPYMLVELLRATESAPVVCCDLGGVTFFGADGANLLALTHLRVAEVRGSFSVRGVHGLVERVLQVTGLDAILRIAG